MNFIKPTISDLLNDLKENKTEAIKNFDNVIILNGIYNRQFLIGDIDQEVGETIESCIRFFNQMDNEDNIPVNERMPIMLFIDSYGGDLGACFTMIDAIEMSKTPVYTIAMGATYSAGFFTFIAGHKKLSYPHASFLYHEGSAGTSGTAGQFENFSAFYKKQLAQLKDHVLKHTGITEEKYKEIKKEDFWMTADEALELGVVDEIITSLEIE